jgi:hypothetical protein
LIPFRVIETGLAPVFLCLRPVADTDRSSDLAKVEPEQF